MAGVDDYYAVLGVPRSADIDEVKRAYRKAALKWHPDKNPDNKEHAERMFKSVAEAYEVLSNPQKRAVYDAGGRQAAGSFFNFGSGPSGFGPVGASRGGVGGMEDAFRIFEQFFAGMDPFADFVGPNPMGPHAGPGAGGFGPGFGMGFGPGLGAGFGGFANFGPAAGGASSFSSFSSSTGFGGGASTSISTSTKIVNGQCVTVTEKTVRKPDGTVETIRTESMGTVAGAPATGGPGMVQDDFFGGAFGGFFGNGRPGGAQGGAAPGRLGW